MVYFIKYSPNTPFTGIVTGKAQGKVLDGKKWVNGFIIFKMENLQEFLILRTMCWKCGLKKIMKMET